MLRHAFGLCCPRGCTAVINAFAIAHARCALQRAPLLKCLHCRGGHGLLEALTILVVTFSFLKFICSLLFREADNGRGHPSCFFGPALWLSKRSHPPQSLFPHLPRLLFTQVRASIMEPCLGAGQLCVVMTTDIEYVHFRSCDGIAVDDASVGPPPPLR